MGEGTSRARRSYAHPPSDDNSTSEYDSDGDSEDSDDQSQLALRDKEEALVESALARIRRAQAKGRKEVKLNKAELAALERRRERLVNEEQRRRRREKEQRFAVPISQLEPTSRKKKAVPAGHEDNLPRNPTPGDLNEKTDRQVYPPMGYFPPPNASRSRPRSGTSSSRPTSWAPNRDRGDSPFSYSYVHNPPPSSRHVSDPAARPRSARGPLPHEEEWVPNPGASTSTPSVNATRQQPTVDPFQFMTAGPRAPYHAGAAAARRHVSRQLADTGYVGVPRVATPAAVSGGSGSRRVSSEETSEETSEDDDDTTSDELGQGARVRDNGSGSQSREAIVVEVDASPDPEPEREPAPRTKKSSSGSSPVKRKPVPSGGGNSSRRRKGR